MITGVELLISFQIQMWCEGDVEVKEKEKEATVKGRSTGPSLRLFTYCVPGVKWAWGLGLACRGQKDGC